MAKQAQIDAVRPVLTNIDKGVTATEAAIDAVVANSEKATAILEEGLEKAADAVPEALDKGVNVTAEIARKGVRTFRSPRTMAFVVIGASIAAGVGIGYLGYRLMKKKLELEFEVRLNEDLDSMRDFYIRRYKTGPFETPESAAETLGAQTEGEARAVNEAHSALDNYQGRGVVAAPQNPPKRVEYDKVRLVQDEVLKGVTISQDGVGTEVRVEEKNLTVQRNVFVEGNPLVIEDWDAEAEEAARNPERPYVISFAEWEENSFEHPQYTLTYYAGDDILAEADDSVINEVESIVGQDNLERFGHGSRDSNVVYIRNERTEADYEVVRSMGKYAEEVHGLRHSAEYSHTRRRPRRGDDE